MTRQKKTARTGQPARDRQNKTGRSKNKIRVGLPGQGG
jgi:hypothetical protein